MGPCRSSDNFTPIGYQWVFKSKEIQEIKLSVLNQDLLPRGSLNMKELISVILSPVSSKDSFRSIIPLVANFDLELHQMDVETAF